MCFKIMSKVVKYSCRLPQYDYTHDQLNTRHFCGIFFLGGGAQNLSLPPGASYTLATPLNRVEYSIDGVKVKFKPGLTLKFTLERKQNVPEVQPYSTRLFLNRIAGC